ncbi:MAG: hypothetical protein ABJC10_08280 [Acidobacteriota bacterium]
MLKRSSASVFLCVALCAAFVVMCAPGIGAQSGRRGNKPAPPLPVPTPETPTATATPKEKIKPAFTFVVGLDRTGDFSRISLNAFSGVLRNCSGRLSKPASVAATVASHDMSRADAIRKAKEEKLAYVVWLQLRPNSFSAQPGSDPYDVYLQYSVFAPITGKQETSGNTYPEAYRNKRIRVPTATTEGDYYLNQAARGAAERILDHFHVANLNPL